MTRKKWDVFIYGDVNVDIVVPDVGSFPLPGQEAIVEVMNTYVGGGAILFALGLGKLGLRPGFQGSVGDDFYGQFITEEMKKNQVDTTLLKISKDKKTGISISFTNERDRSFLTYRGTNDEMDLDAIRLDQAKEARHTHLTQYAGRQNHDQYLKLLKALKQNEGMTISMDVGWDDTGEWYEGIYALLPFIDVLFMNETEAIHYSRKDNVLEAVEDFSTYCKGVVAKLGKEGSLALFDGQCFKVSPYSVTAVDTTGAGDSFNAGFIYGFLKASPIDQCLKYGNGCGAMSVTEYGGNTGFPTEEELIAFLKDQDER